MGAFNSANMSMIASPHLVVVTQAYVFDVLAALTELGLLMSIAWCIAS